MSARDHLNTEQFTDVYHATMPDNAASLNQQKKFSGEHAFVSTHSDSDFMNEFGDARVHLRVPSSALEPDPGEEMDRANGWAPMHPDERHYQIPSDKVKPEHFVNITGVTGKEYPSRFSA